MAEITVEEARTVVEEQTRIKCDHCGFVESDDEFTKVTYQWEGERVDPEFRHLCSQCCDIPEAHQAEFEHRKRLDYLKDLLSGLQKTKWTSIFLFGFAFGLWMFRSFAVVELDTDKYPEQFAYVFVNEATFGFLTFGLVCVIVGGLGILLGKEVI